MEGLRDPRVAAVLRNTASTILFRLYITFRALVTPSVFGVAGAVYDHEGRVLLVRQRYTWGWRLPGGGVDRGEPARTALLRELSEEVGLRGGVAELFGIYNRPAGWASNVVALYRVTGATVNFKPSLEILEICYADPAKPPPDCSAATLRRLKELAGRSQSDLTW
jgi:8-oxo-dGTP pyrophosphatase MutT (NUDIX family)